MLDTVKIFIGDVARPYAIIVVAVTETVEETYEVMEPTGETRLGLRHEQLLMLFLAVLAEGG